MSKLGGLFMLAFASLAAAACATTTGGGQGGGFGGSGLQATVLPPGMTAAQGAAYCAKLSQTYAEYVGTVGGYLGGVTTGGEAADLDARVAIAQCQDGNYASGIPALQQKLRDARVTVPPPPTAG
ncbi:MAG TPA: hypothetical protein VG224_04090 [Reyranella sp.]|jgi:hypothetical protein|nr:hypothetical protein [Reyranella sp.]